jgi:Trypsin-co-occurring domain 2
MDAPENDLSIRTLIQAVTKELLQSQSERQAGGTPAVFEVSGLTLDISFVATTSKRGGGGFDLKVVKADAGVQYDQQSIHKITLTLTAVDVEQPFGGRGKVHPRAVLEDNAQDAN